MPGKSTTVTFFPSKSSVPCAFSTVFPGQFPIIWLEPVSWLNITLLPTLAFPARAIVMFRLIRGLRPFKDESLWHAIGVINLVSRFAHRQRRRSQRYPV